MTRPAPPALTVRYDGSSRTFAAGNDVVIGRDLRADLRVAHPLISRAHVILRFDQGRWMAIDNGSLNGMFVNGRRVPVVDLTDGLHVNIGNPDGPQLTFEVGRHQGSVGTPPQTTAVPVAGRPSNSWPTQPPPAASPPMPPPGTFALSTDVHATRPAAALPVGPPAVVSQRTAVLPQRAAVVSQCSPAALSHAGASAVGQLSGPDHDRADGATPRQ